MTLQPRLELLAAEEVERIVGEAGRVLATIGVRVESAEGERLLAAAGATSHDGRWRIPELAVQAALASAPRQFEVYDRDGGEALAFGRGRVQFDPGSAALHLLDATSERRRPATSADLVALARLVDGLPHYAAQSTALVAADVPEAIADRYRLYLALRHGRKPVVTGTFRQDGLAPMLALLAAVRGGERELASRPLALFDCCPTSPLAWSDLTCDSLIGCARAGVPVQLVSVPLAGATAPVTLRDAIVQHCAENLSGLVLHQQACAGAPVVYGGAPAAFDMRQGTAVMAAVESLMIGVGYAQVGRHLGLPTHGYMGLSEAKTLDYQAGMESLLGAVLAGLAGLDLVSGPGLLDYLLTQSLEKLLLDHEACGLALRLTRGISTGGEPGAVELIGEAVRLGQLLGHPHTRGHWRQELSVASPLLDRATWGDWVAAGARGAAERARDEVTRRLALPAPAPLAPAVAAELDAILLGEARRAGLNRLPWPLDL